MLKQLLIYDIETETFGKVDPYNDKLKFVGFRFPDGRKVMYHANQKDKIQNTISSYRYLCGHNIKKRYVDGEEYGYDNIVMERHGFKFLTKSNKPHIFIDTQEITEKRAKSMLYIDFPKNKRSLSYLADYFKLECTKDDIDYSVFKKKIFSLEDLKNIKKYLYADLDTTYYLFKKYYDFFFGISKFLSPKQNLDLDWLLCPSGTLGYKWYCYVTGKQYVIDKFAKRNSFSGAIMWVSDVKSAENVVVFDFASLYPNMMVGGNTFSHLVSLDAWTGTGIFKEYVKGSFSTIQGKFEKKVSEMFLVRKEIKKQMKKLSPETEEYKDLDRTQLGIKILLNSSYGASGSPIFKNMYNDNTCSTITGMARACITHARDVFERHGYKIIYLHTDSLYVQDTKNDLEQVKALANGITRKQISDMNILNENHNFEFEKCIDKMWLVQGDDGTNKRNRNVCLSNGKVSYTGIKLCNLGTSKLSHNVFKYISEHLKTKPDTLYIPLDTMLEWYKKEAMKDLNLLKKRFRIKTKDNYKSKTSIHYSICEMFGAGEHYLIPNKFFGAGKVSKYDTLENLKKYDLLDIVSWDKYIKEVSEFIDPKERKRI